MNCFIVIFSITGIIFLLFALENTNFLVLDYSDSAPTFRVFVRTEMYKCPIKFHDKRLWHNNDDRTKRKARDFSFPTDFRKSVVEIINPQRYYNICDNVAVRIQARGANGSMKTYGGDYFRTKLYTDKPYSAMGPDYFFDYDNGTYLALFTLRWTGTVRVSVLLVHSSEAVEVLNRTTEGSASTVFTFRGEFQTKTNGGKVQSEKVTCGVAPFKPPMCNESSNHTHGPWFCMMPKNKYLRCQDFFSISMDPTSKGKLQTSITKEELMLFKSTKVKLSTAKLPLIKILDAGLNSSRFSICTPGVVPTTVETRGLFYNNNWHPLDCKIKQFQNDQISSCLREKSIHIYGDSTGRQMYDFLAGVLNCSTTKNEYLKDCEIRNHSIHFRFHGPPVRGSQIIPVKTLRYVAEQIDDLKGGPGVVIVLSIWAHFGVPDGSFYRERLQAIKGAIQRLWERSPETQVIVRSANTRGHSIGGFILISSDWIALQGEKTLRSVFSDDKRFSFLDVWDMTLVQRSKDAIHPLEPTLVQIMDYFLTLIC